MASAIASDLYAEEKMAWLELTPSEQQTAITYNLILRQDFDTDEIKWWVWEILKIQARVPNFCPVLSVPTRMVC